MKASGVEMWEYWQLVAAVFRCTLDCIIYYLNNPHLRKYIKNKNSTTLNQFLDCRQLIELWTYNIIILISNTQKKAIKLTEKKYIIYR